MNTVVIYIKQLKHSPLELTSKKTCRYLLAIKLVAEYSGEKESCIVRIVTLINKLV